MKMGFPPVVKQFPTGFRSSTELVPMFKKELELCKVKKGETVLLFTDPLFRPHYPAAFAAAAMELGAFPVEMVVPSTTEDLSAPMIVETWKAADLIIGMTTVPWLYTDAHNEALDAGARSLMVVEPEDCLRRMFPCEEVRRRSEAGAKVITAGKTVRVTSPAGTDLVMSIEGRKGGAGYGYTDRPGYWSHWPSGAVSVAPVEGSVEGTLVVNTGDIIFRINRYVEHPIEIGIREGRIASIKGGLDAILLKEYLAHWGDDKAYIVSHIGWGTEHRALWNTLGIRYVDGGGIMDAETFMGNMQIAFGSNFTRKLGGNNKTKAHIDIPCRNHSFYVDDQIIVDKGVIVAEGLK